MKEMMAENIKTLKYEKVKSEIQNAEYFILNKIYVLMQGLWQRREGNKVAFLMKNFYHVI